mmetsp:Transcript_29940/g.45376  ORF Transcript_29940/g.45376 Transcript_29940/m.45376 type:complete len:179 (-) Transcript_29940:123-659(-)
MMTDFVTDGDVLLGRGGATNNHVGNRNFRNTVADHQQEYLKAKKKEKALISKRIVHTVRHQGGRFLRRNEKSDKWIDVGDKKAIEKTSQALREGLDVRARQIEKSSTKHTARTLDSIDKKRRRIEENHTFEPLSNVISKSEESNTMPDLDEEIPKMMPSFIFKQHKLTIDDTKNLVEV